MTIALTEQIVIDGANPGDEYIRARFDNGYECFINQSWGDDAIAEEIQSIIDRFDGNNPPINWKPYNGFNA